MKASTKLYTIWTLDDAYEYIDITKTYDEHHMCSIHKIKCEGVQGMLELLADVSLIDPHEAHEIARLVQHIKHEPGADATWYSRTYEWDDEGASFVPEEWLN